MRAEAKQEVVSPLDGVPDLSTRLGVAIEKADEECFGFRQPR